MIPTLSWVPLKAGLRQEFEGAWFIFLCYPRKNQWRSQWHPTPVLLPGKSHGWRSLEGCSPWGRWGSDTTKRLHFYFSLSCIGEGNGNPLQCSCLENPRDGGAWWAAVYEVAQSRTPLKWLSSSSRKNREGSQEVRCREGGSKLTKFQQEGYPCQKVGLSPSGSL